MTRRWDVVFAAVLAVALVAVAPPIEALDSNLSTKDVVSGVVKAPLPISKNDSPAKVEPGSKASQTVKPPKPAKPSNPVIKDPVNGVENFLDTLVLVNKSHAVSADKVPPDLTRPNVQFSNDAWNKLMRKEAALALEELFEKAGDEDVDLLAVSGYRSYQSQAAIFAYRASQVGETEANRFSARAGQSEHQTGLAMDITCPDVDNQLSQNFGSTPEGQWVAEHAANFGFIIRYQQGKENITGYSYEPWHIRYVGVEAARAISDNGLTLEEFLAQME